MEKKIVEKKAFLWNMIGSICYSGSSFFYLLLVTRMCGVNEAGVFSLAFATAQLLLTIGRFGVRTYQATDLKRHYSFREYGISRIFTCFLMLAGAFVYVFSLQFDLWKAEVCIWVTAFKMLDAVEDVYHGELQRLFRVDLMGKALALRNFSSCALFALFIIVTKDILITCIITTIISLIICILANNIFLHKLKYDIGTCEWLHIKRLMISCFPIFLSTFLSLYLYNVPKYAIDTYMEIEYQTYYSILFMPSFVITLFSEIVSKPIMTTITLSWENDIKRFCRLTGILLGMIGIGTILIVLGGHFIGRRLLELIYGVDLSSLKTEFIVLLFGGGISASVYILYNLLIAIRHQKCIIFTYGCTAFAMTLEGFWLVKHNGMMGAVLGYLFSCFILEVIFLTILIFLIHSRKGINKHGG